MRIIEASVEIVKSDNPLKVVELAGRTCYKSEKKITSNSYQAFVDKMIESGHLAMLEHANYTFERKLYDTFLAEELERYRSAKSIALTDFMKFTPGIVTANLRTLTELGVDIQGFVKTERYRLLDIEVMEALPLRVREVHKHITLRFVCDRGVSHELVRHRTVSFAQESTRFCNYGKGLTFIKPCFFEYGEYARFSDWRETMQYVEEAYLGLLDRGCKPEEARTVLPNSLKTEVIMTTNIVGWKHFLDLRYRGITGKPHPQMYEVAKLACELLRIEDPEAFAEY